MANLGKIDWKIKTYFSSFSNLSYHNFESMFYIKKKKNPHINVRDSVLISLLPSSELKALHYTRLFMSTLWGLV